MINSVKKKFYTYMAWFLAFLFLIFIILGLCILSFSPSKYFFVHITKTGGSSFLRWRQKAVFSCASVFVSESHFYTSQMAIDLGYKPVTIIREPLERFRSSFSYWKNGSKDVISNQRPKGWKKGDSFPNISLFIDALRSEKSPLHVVALDAIEHRDDFTWSQHFEPQSSWIDTDDEKVEIICYDKENLAKNIQKIFDKNKVFCPVLDMPKNNVTLNVDKTPFSRDQISWLKDKYKKDFFLWEKYCSKKK